MYRDKNITWFFIMGLRLLNGDLVQLDYSKFTGWKCKCTCEWLHIGASGCAVACACVYGYAFIYGKYKGQ